METSIDNTKTLENLANAIRVAAEKVKERRYSQLSVDVYENWIIADIVNHAKVVKSENIEIESWMFSI